ncbi:hypothetical protein C1A40_07875 [Tamlana carrageenivorans]|uniref:Uncharacterized protein n=1 Tax=Pseudotamlana carrageenivorans TaxID=2069432 RepID=A0A2I7SHM1_9FLAO|nr:hypothetical protein C1A40_07875 [Tamlana carrageenivorans]
MQWDSGNGTLQPFTAQGDNSSEHIANVTNRGPSSSRMDYNCNESQYVVVAKTTDLSPSIGEGSASNIPKLIMNIGPLAIEPSEYSSFEFRVSLAIKDNGVGRGHYDWFDTGKDEWKNDYVQFDYEEDSNTGIWNPLIWVYGRDVGKQNTRASIVENFITTPIQGAGKNFISKDFEQYTATITIDPSTTSITLRTEFHLNAGSEDIAIDQIEIWGTPNSQNVITTAWDGTSWTPHAPKKDDFVLINADYNTANANSGSFEANGLKLATGAKLTISDNTYVSIVNEVDA